MHVRVCLSGVRVPLATNGVSNAPLRGARAEARMVEWARHGVRRVPLARTAHGSQTQSHTHVAVYSYRKQQSAQNTQYTSHHLIALGVILVVQFCTAVR